MLLQVVNSLDTGTVFTLREPEGFTSALQSKLEALALEHPPLADLCCTALLALAVTRDDPEVAIQVALDMARGESHDTELAFEVPRTLRHLFDQIASPSSGGVGSGSVALVPSVGSVTDSMELKASAFDDAQGHDSERHQCAVASDGAHLYVHTKEMLFKVGAGHGTSIFGAIVSAAPMPAPHGAGGVPAHASLWMGVAGPCLLRRWSTDTPGTFVVIDAETLDVVSEVVLGAQHDSPPASPPAPEQRPLGVASASATAVAEGANGKVLDGKEATAAANNAGLCDGDDSPDDDDDDDDDLPPPLEPVPAEGQSIDGSRATAASKEEVQPPPPPPPQHQPQQSQFDGKPIHFALGDGVIGTLVVDGNEVWTARMHQFKPETMQLVPCGTFDIRNAVERPVSFGSLNVAAVSASAAAAAPSAANDGAAAAAALPHQHGAQGCCSPAAPPSASSSSSSSSSAYLVPLGGIDSYSIVEFAKSQTCVLARTLCGRVLVQSTKALVEDIAAGGGTESNNKSAVAGSKSSKSSSSASGERGTAAKKNLKKPFDHGQQVPRPQQQQQQQQQRKGWSLLSVPGDDFVTSVAASQHHQYALVFVESGKTFTVGETGDGDLAAKALMLSAEPTAETELSHPSHSHDVKFNSRQSGWNCDVCRYRSSQQPVRKRYRCVSGCDWDACDVCMEGPFAAWRLAHAPDPTESTADKCAPVDNANELDIVGGAIGKELCIWRNAAGGVLTSGAYGSNPVRAWQHLQTPKLSLKMALLLATSTPT